ncbi:MAG: IS66 family transposase [Acidobacteriaceae bacterium]|nr:IS66 family transposase [Acidobacteriaceae bacterium]
MPDVPANTAHLPKDRESLQAMVRSLLRERDTLQILSHELQQKQDELYVENLRLQVELARYKKQYYGPRADRLHTEEELAQALLDFGEALEQKPANPDDEPPCTEPDQGVEKVAKVKKVRANRQGRRKLAAVEDLPVKTYNYELTGDERACPCCGVERKRIGQEERWQIEYFPAHYERIQHVRGKYACPACELNGDNPNIETAPMPKTVIDKGLAGPGLLAYIAVSKYDTYIPLYRLDDIFARNGFRVARSTQSVWCGKMSDGFERLWELMAERVRASHVVATDDTIMPMQAAGKTANARMWVYVGDESNPYNVFDFTLHRGRDGPKYFLKDYKQVLLADAYGGYNGVVAGNGITRAGCMAHLRRKIIDAEKAAPQITQEAVALIRQLYEVEKEVKTASVEQRLEMRQQRSEPVMTRLHEKFLAWKNELLPKHPMTEAINYALNQWQELNVFLSDGAVPIDNNISEREMKRVVLNRKNSLFVGNARGGKTAAILSSLTSTCRRLEIDPQLYLTQLLTNLPTIADSDLADWLPDRWKLAQVNRLTQLQDR